MPSSGECCVGGEEGASFISEPPSALEDSGSLPLRINMLCIADISDIIRGEERVLNVSHLTKMLSGPFRELELHVLCVLISVINCSAKVLGSVKVSSELANAPLRDGFGGPFGDSVSLFLERTF